MTPVRRVSAFKYRSFGCGLLAASLAAVVLLDFARSYYARSAAAEPATAWPAKQASAWPPGVDLPENTTPGEAVYIRRCAVCHDASGKGDGPAAPGLRPGPRDFSRGVFKFKSAKGSVPPGLDDVRRSIRDGIAGTSMPAWRGLLSDAEIDAVAEHVRQLGGLKQWSPEATEPPASDTILAGASAERGKESYAALGCQACHGEHARGDGASAPDLRDVWKQPVGARDLTAPWSYRWGAERQTVYRWIAYGVSGTPMPGYLEAAEPQQIADVVAYLESIARRPPWQGGSDPDPPKKDPVWRGEYLVRTNMCGMCHTPVDESGIYQTQTHHLAGGMKIAAGGHGIFFAANLTSDEETGLGKRSAEEIAVAIRTGHTSDRRLNFWGMPWMVYGSLPPDDALAIAIYLKTLPAVRNRAPQPLYFGSLETVARKIFYPWPAMTPPQLQYSSGNFGDSGEGTAPFELQTWLVRFQRLFAVLAVIGWLMLRRSAASDAHRHGGIGTATVLLVLFGGAAIAFVDRYPALSPMPAAPIVAGFAAGVPPVTADDAAAPTVLHGQQLFIVSSCAFCHGGDGSGGNKVSWRGFGSVWSANLTPHSTGLAAWTDEEIMRVLRSGVSRDGRQLHWQAMPWDSFSNYSEEDLRSLIAFIRRLPPVERNLTQAVAPSAHDCASYTFWVRNGGDRAGCES